MAEVLKREENKSWRWNEVSLGLQSEMFQTTASERRWSHAEKQLIDS